MAHTPGPWDRQGTTVFSLDEQGRVNRFSTRVDGGYVNGGICQLFSDAAMRTTEDEMLANAVLIQSAPDLLTKAEELLAALEGEPEEVFAGEIGDEIAALRSAVARAKGE